MIKPIIETLTGLFLAIGMSVMNCGDPHPFGFLAIICWAFYAGISFTEIFDEYDDEDYWEE